jgi:hypothetical protein
MSLPRIAAHLILGPREEPFLGAMLESIAGAVAIVIVNDNAPDSSPHAQNAGSVTLRRAKTPNRRSRAVPRICRRA